MKCKMDLIPLILLSPILVFVGYFDMRYMRIPNTLSLIALALFIITAPLLSWPELAARLTIAGIVFLTGTFAFAMRWLGGGDVKIMSCLMLFVPSQSLALFAFGFSASMLIGVFFILTIRAAPWLSTASWASVQARGKFPMGISIALSGIIHPFLTSAFTISWIG